ncbi:hypothetical protein A3K86_19730 [Photobacterium jeanii]|uniref:Uncharacterized protein n=1 Tax=Photobacterium jeanii TaxID=858640 RepID=A0A178K392_9GAMM|nr:hypothetical protein A3K86_19730 [Photobacterium jeanii]PST90711.1 hypothetical protein C9I91_08830 [Photobacterium jeanii]
MWALLVAVVNGELSSKLTETYHTEIGINVPVVSYINEAAPIYAQQDSTEQRDVQQIKTQRVPATNPKEPVFVQSDRKASSMWTFMVD